MSGRQTLMFRQLGREFQRRGWLAKPVTVDSFVTARSYLARLAGSGDGGAVQVYGMLCPAVVDRDAETAAALETSFLAGTSDGEGDGPWAAEALLADCLPGLLPDGPCHALEEMRRQAPPSADFLMNYGYRCLGPILALFGRWVWRQWRASGRGLLVGLLRDGRLLGQGLAAVCPEAESVLREAWLSRRMCLTAAIRSADDRDGLRTALIRARGVPVTVGVALAELGLTAEGRGCPLPPGRRLDAAGFDAFCDWLAGRAALRDELDRHCRGLRRAVIGHLDAANVLDRNGIGGGGIGLVDIGYAGNLQRVLAIILSAENRSTPLWGAYLITSEGALWTAATAGPVSGYLAGYGGPSWLSSLWLRAREVFESLLAQPFGALKGYGGDGVAMPDDPALPPAQLSEIARIQKGALAFARHWGGQTTDDADDADEPVRLAQLRLIAARMLLLPSAELRWLGNWLCDDTLALGEPRRLTEPVTSARDAFLAPRARLLWPAGSAVAHAAATPPDLLAAWIARRAEGRSQER
jgi:hypothetical protein